MTQNAQPSTTSQYHAMQTPRIPPLPRDQWEPETEEQLGGSLTAPDDSPLNIFATLANHPKLLKRWLVFANHVLFKSALPPRDRELLILRTGWNCCSPYEWGQHVLIALESGITDEEIEEVTVGPDAPGWDPFDAALLRAADELHHDAVVSDATWALLAQRYTAEQLLDTVFTVGQYHTVAFALNSCGVELDEGVPFDPRVTDTEGFA
jgi:alkylhydroperoxidase family enzyme